MRDGNTISDGKWIRRGLPLLSETVNIPKSRNIELISFTKTNGDCCMFTQLKTNEGDMFLIATRNMSILVKDIASLNKIEGKFSMHK